FSERLYLGHQCRDSASLARVLAVRVVQRDLDHVEVCAAREGPASLESVELRDLRVVVSGAGDGGGADDSVGQLYLAAAGHLGAWIDHYLACETNSHQRDLCAF